MRRLRRADHLARRAEHRTDLERAGRAPASRPRSSCRAAWPRRSRASFGCSPRDTRSSRTATATGRSTHEPRGAARRAGAVAQDHRGRVRTRGHRVPRAGLLDPRGQPVGARCARRDGFELDSSIFPMRTRRYGIAGWEVTPHHVPLRTAAGSWRFLWRSGRAPACGARWPAAATSACCRTPLLERALRCDRSGPAGDPLLPSLRVQPRRARRLPRHRASRLLASPWDAARRSRADGHLFEGLRFGRFDQS